MQISTFPIREQQGEEDIEEYGVSFQGDGNVLELVVMVIEHCIYTENY